MSNDESVIGQINTALLAAEVQDGQNNTMTEALEDVEDAGFLIENLSPTSKGYHYAWDQEHDRFALVKDMVATPEVVFKATDKEFTSDPWNIWYMVTTKAEAENKTYSVCISPKFEGSVGDLVVKGGVDAYTNTTITSITFTGETSVGKNVIFNTNGGILTVTDRELASHQDHYGTLDEANITTGLSCYNEHGTVNRLELEEGKVIAKEDGIVYLMEAKSDTAAAEEDGGIIIVPEDATIYATSTDSGIGKSLTDLGYEVNPSSSSDEPAELEVPAAKQEEIANCLFEGGEGTESNPYKIKTREQLESVSYFNTYAYYEWVGESKVDASNWSSSIYLCGSFDGNGVIFDNLDCFLFRSVWNGSDSWHPNEDLTNTYTISNLTVNANNVGSGWNTGVVRVAGVHNFVMENVTVHGYIEGAYGVTIYSTTGALEARVAGAVLSYSVNCN